MYGVTPAGARHAIADGEIADIVANFDHDPCRGIPGGSCFCPLLVDHPPGALQALFRRHAGGRHDLFGLLHGAAPERHGTRTNSAHFSADR
jgi:hypothetical protein